MLHPIGKHSGCIAFFTRYKLCDSSSIKPTMPQLHLPFLVSSEMKDVTTIEICRTVKSGVDMNSLYKT